MSSSDRVSTVTFPPALRAGLIGRFGAVDLAFFSVALIATWMGLNGIGSGWSTPIAAFVLALLVALVPLAPRVGGRRATDFILPAAGALLDRATGRGVYRGAVFAPRSLAERMDLPGDLAGFRLIEMPAADGLSRIGVMVNDREKVAVVVALTFGGTLSTKDDAEQAVLLDGWEQVLSMLASPENGLRRFQLLVRSAPDSSNLAARHLYDKGTVRSGLVWQNAQALVTGPAADSPRHEVFLVLEFSLKSMSEELSKIDGKWGDAAIGAVLRDRLVEVERALQEEQISTQGWLRPGQYASLIRTQFDPDAQPLHDMLAGVSADSDTRMAGPAATERSWKFYRHDSGVSQTLWIHEMPGRPVRSMFLAPLLQPHGECRRSLSIVTQPLNESSAESHLQRQAQRADQQVSGRERRQLPVSARSRKEARAIAAQDAAIADKDTLFRYLIFITVTAPDEQRCRRGVLAVQRRVKKANCESAVLYGEQDQGFFAGALPFARGLVPMRGKR